MTDKEQEIEEIASIIMDTTENREGAGYRDIAEEIVDAGYHKEDDTHITLPCKVGGTVFKICPVCNEHHKGSCKNYARSGWLTNTGCTVGVGVYFDGSYNKSPLQVVEKTVNWNYMQEVIARWGIMFFPTRELAEKALEEYDAIRSIKNCDQRIEEYEKWEAGADRRIKEATL